MIGIQPYVDFTNFMNAAVTLWRVSTGEDYYLIMFDTMRNTADGCIENVSCGLCNLFTTDAHSILFFLFILIVQYIILNVFLLILMQTFEENYINNNNVLQNFQEMMAKF